jgi:hypothetical protein
VRGQGAGHRKRYVRPERVDDAAAQGEAKCRGVEGGAQPAEVRGCASATTPCSRWNAARAAIADFFIKPSRRAIRSTSGPVRLAPLNAAQITDFVTDYARRKGATATQTMASGLRSFLQYLQQRGDVVGDLAS